MTDVPISPHAPSPSRRRWLALIPFFFILGFCAYAFFGLPGVPSDLGPLGVLTGRMHPVVLHMPVGLLMVLPVLHLAHRFRILGEGTSALGLIRLILWLVAFSAMAASFCGLLLVREGGYDGASNHFLAALVFTAFTAVLALYGTLVQPGQKWRQRGYFAMLGLALALMTVAAHLGADLTHGEAFLKDPILELMGKKKPKSKEPESAAIATPGGAEPSAYAKIIAPIIKEKCTNWHAETKSKGGLRLDTLEMIMAGGDTQKEKGKKVVTPGDPANSTLIKSMKLPLDDEDHMPPEGKPQHTTQELALLEWWVTNGANDTTPASAAPVGK